MRTRLALLLPLLAAAACRTDNNASVRMMAICAPPDDATNCSFSATCDAHFIGRVAMDAALTVELVMMVQVDNLLPDNKNDNTGRTNTNDAFIQEYDIEYVDFGVTAAVRPLGNATVPAGGTAVATVLVVPDWIGTSLRTQLVAGAVFDTAAKIKAKGIYADGTRFETAAFEVSLRACNNTPGCTPVLQCAVGDLLAVCPGIGFIGTPATGVYTLGQMPAAATCVTP